MRRTRKIYHVILTVLFLCIISFSYLNDIFGFYKAPESSQSENRRLAARPAFNLGKLDPFPKAYEKFFNDRFPFRGELGFANSVICFFGFHQSPIPGEVELGKNGWLFYDQKESRVYEGKFNLPERDVSLIVRELHDRTLYYRQQGRKFYVSFPPIKPEIYPEFLPDDFVRSATGTLTDRLIRAIRKDTVIQFIDIREALLQAKPKARLYKITDNHWNEIGGFYGYTAIINRMRKDFPKIKPMTLSDFHFIPNESFGGNLATMIGFPKLFHETLFLPKFNNKRAWELDPVHKTPEWAKDLNYYEKIRSTGDTSLPSALFIDDSFSDALMPFLEESFSKSIFLFDGWRYDRNDKIINDLDPDIVMLIIFEPHIPHLIGIW